MYPILEFDDKSKTILDPTVFCKNIEGVEFCVMCFFREVIEKVVAEYHAIVKVNLHSEIGDHPIYEIDYQGKKVSFFHPGIGAPLAAGLMDESIACGFRKFVACGGAGVLDSSIQVGKIVIPFAAVRDEGTSYHYVPPSRELEISKDVVDKLVAALTSKKVPYILAKTWTTDAFYRETENRRDKRKSEGCLTVEMECSAFAAVAKHRNVMFGQYLYGGDDISGTEWDHRKWTRHEMREKLFWLSVEACLSL